MPTPPDGGGSPTSLLEHFDFIWKVLIMVGTALFFSVKFIGRSFKKRIELLEARQEELRKIVPKEALEKGYLLMTVSDCAKSREGCQNVVFVEQIQDTLKVIKKAVLVMVLHSESIPKEDRDKIAKDLLE